MAAVNIPQPGRPALGPPSRPIDFPEPRIHFGIRVNVLCYNTKTRQDEVFEDVLFRDLSRSPIDENDEDPNDRRIHEAYWRIPDKPTMRTNNGEVVIYLVLEWRPEQNGDIEFRTTNEWVAIKVNERRRIGQHADNPIKEIAALQLIGDQHPNVLGCRQVLQDEENIYVVMRYCDSGELLAMKGNQARFREGQARYWFRQLIRGVRYLHSVGICHRDLSPENVMIDQREQALIIDMGMCLCVPYTTTLNPTVHGFMDLFVATEMARNQGSVPLRCLFTPQEGCGKFPYMSPEIYKEEEFDGEAIDVWTCGTILFYMITGFLPYEKPDATDRCYPWVTRLLPRLLQHWEVKLSREALDLLQKILKEDPQLRLTLDEIENHQWLALPEERPDGANA